MARIPVALQLYSVRDDCERDFPATLKAVAKIGYAGVEFAGYYGFSAEELRKMLDELGLETAGSHTPLETLLEDELERTIEFNQILGNRFLIVPIAPERKSRADWLEVAKILNEIAKKLGPHKMNTGYHNHFDEFKAVEGELAWDIIFGNTKLEVVMQFDIGNAVQAGADAAPFLEKYPGRALTVHLKEYSKTNDKALIGEGDVPWQEVFRLCESMAGTRWYIVEQERYAYSPLECADRNLRALREMGR
ncbi:MAG: TIM barrel protein [Armatimonadetes bacterium]|nr:TIM barrel protein [Armatimonadota bacterium]NIO74608.1 TIM barrel protein [Armatimonadota bacterium]NIO96563.1 TIM barrel protein [Armatimonadota bacterium]